MRERGRANAGTTRNGTTRAIEGRKARVVVVVSVVRGVVVVVITRQGASIIDRSIDRRRARGRSHRHEVAGGSKEDDGADEEGDRSNEHAVCLANRRVGRVELALEKGGDGHDATRAVRRVRERASRGCVVIMIRQTTTVV